MTGPIRAILRNEFAKLARHKMPYLGLAAVLLMCVVIFVFTRRISPTRDVTGWEAVAFAVNGCMADVGLLVILIVAAGLMAEETGTGTIRMVLSSPVTRTELLLTKALIVNVYVLIVSASAMMLSLCLAAWRHDFGDIVDVATGPAAPIYTWQRVMLNLVLAWLLSLLPLSASAMFGLLCSVLARTAGQAITAAIGVLVVAEAVKGPLKIAPVVFTTYIPMPWTVFHEIAGGINYAWAPQVWYLVISSVVYSTAFLAICAFVLRKRDFTG